MCEDGSIRLMDGEIEQEGRVELCMNGVWGTLCSSSFTITEAYVICKLLGRKKITKGKKVN